MISKDLARKFIEQVTRYTDYNVNIMDAEGVIIASRDAVRIGQYHEAAHRIIRGQEDIVCTNAGDYPNVRPGVNMVIEADGLREGVVGVTGDPEEIRPVALIVKMSIETMLKYERQQEAVRLRKNRKTRFTYLLTQEKRADPEELRALAEELGYSEEPVRIPILIRTKDAEPEAVLSFLRNGGGRARSDLGFVLDSHHVLIFKALGDDSELFSNYKFAIGEYLMPLIRQFGGSREAVSFFIGSFQSTYKQYYYAYQHCRWLERGGRADRQIVFFYDYVEEYLQDYIPTEEMQRIFSLFEDRIAPDKLRLYREALGVLLQTNFNFAKAAKLLYVHKNTLVYRYNAMKELLNLDPVVSASDRAFLGAFYRYMKRKLC